MSGGPLNYDSHNSNVWAHREQTFLLCQMMELSTQPSRSRCGCHRPRYSNTVQLCFQPPACYISLWVLMCWCPFLHLPALLLCVLNIVQCWCFLSLSRILCAMFISYALFLYQAPGLLDWQLYLSSQIPRIPDCRESTKAKAFNESEDFWKSFLSQNKSLKGCTEKCSQRRAHFAYVTRSGKQPLLILL